MKLGQWAVGILVEMGGMSAIGDVSACGIFVGGRGVDDECENRGRVHDEFIAGLPDWQPQAAQILRDLVKRAAPRASEAVKWSQPVFEFNGPFCYLQTHSGHLNFGFWRGVDLEDPEGLLQGTGKKMRHVKITGPNEIPIDALQAMVKQAVQLNDEKGVPTRSSG
jgi:hypothetical protein